MNAGDNFKGLSTYELCALYCDYHEWLGSPAYGPKNPSIRAKYEEYLDGIVAQIVRISEIMAEGKRVAEDERTGPGTFRVIVIPPTRGDYVGVREFIWECNHEYHAENKAKKRGLVVEMIERVREGE